MKAGLSEIVPGMIATAALGLVLLMLLVLYEICRWHWKAWWTKRGVALSTNQEEPAHEIETAEAPPDARTQEVASVDFQVAQDNPLVETFGMHESADVRESLTPEPDEVEQLADDGEAETDDDAFQTEDFSDDVPPQDEFPQDTSREENAGHDREARKRGRGERGADGDRKSRKRDQVRAEETTNDDNKRALRLARKERRNAPANENEVREQRRNKQ